MSLHLFQGAFLTKYHELCGLKQQKLIPSQFQRLEVLSYCVSRSLPSLLVSGSHWLFSAFLVLQLHNPSLSLCSHMAVVTLWVCVLR